MNEELIIRYLQGQCAPAEEDLLLKWLQESPENKKFFYEQKALLNYSKVKHFGTDEQISQAAGKISFKRSVCRIAKKKTSVSPVCQVCSSSHIPTGSASDPLQRKLFQEQSKTHHRFDSTN